MDSNYRKTANSRAEFARERWNEILLSFNVSKSGALLESIAGYNARKLAQAYKIYTYYLFIFNGSKPRGTTFYNKSKTKKKNK